MNFSEQEKEILKTWKKKKIFEKTLQKNKKNKRFVFYDGPPFATGLPHYGHILSSTIKDVIPRYWTMKGYYVPRRWGWDCHGLPIENLVEKELKVSGKKDIEKQVGIEKFNQTCCQKVLTYTKEWKEMVERIGRWIEFDNAYKTMDPTYIESVWWALKTIHEKNLIYEGRKVLMYCPRCETPVSKAEIAMDNSYKDVTEESATVKFQIKEPEKLNLSGKVFALAWTTTPWTLPANVALAVGKNINYVAVKTKNETYLLAEDKIDIIKEKHQIVSKFKGKDLIDLEYVPLYEVGAVKNSGKKAWYLTEADFVNTEDGTGIVHTAVIYGEDDYELGQKKNLPEIPLLNSQGVFNQKAPKIIQGKYFKEAEKIIKEDLSSRKLLFSLENYTHSYPFCWRCDTQLFYNAISAWFINIQKVKKQLIKLNEKINWYPSHLKHGRFLNILKTAPDWNISRNRFWASPLPFWKCECGEVTVIGSVKELKEKAVNFSEVFKADKVEKLDLHKDKVDKIKLKCKCGKEVKRIPEVIDCWVESASMFFAELHYPFENKEEFKKRLPAQYIAEYIAQTRTWFYYMHAMAVLLFDDISYENVVSTGTILNEKGEKLSKSKQNYPDPWKIIDLYGVDALRFYLLSSSVMQAENLFFAEREVREIHNKVINILDNVIGFYSMYAKDIKKKEKSKNILDRWILSRLNNLILEVTQEMDSYNTVKSGRLIREFTDDLSLWYVRRSRNRFKLKDASAASTLEKVLLELSKVIAPFTPFLAEKMYLGPEISVHLDSWPKANKKLIDNKLEEKMKETRETVSLVLAKRAEAGIKVRQPLAELTIKSKLDKELLELIKEETNVKKIVVGKSLKLDTKITEELRKEGEYREMVRNVNGMRKKMKLTPKDTIEIESTFQVINLKDFLKEVKAKSYQIKDKVDGEEIKVNNQKHYLLIKKI